MRLLSCLTIVTTLFLAQAAAFAEDPGNRQSWRHRFKGINLRLSGSRQDAESTVNAVQLRVYIECLEEWFEGRENAPHRKKRKDKWTKLEKSCHELTRAITLNGERVPFKSARILKPPAKRQELRERNPAYQEGAKDPGLDLDPMREDGFFGSQEPQTDPSESGNVNEFVMPDAGQVTDHFLQYLMPRPAPGPGPPVRLPASRRQLRPLLLGNGLRPGR